MELVQKKQELAPQSHFDRHHLDLIKEMYFKGASDEEFQMFIYVCKKTGLDPAMRQIHPVKRWDSKMKKEVMTVQTGIDGYRLIAERTGRYAPGREPTYQYNKEGELLSATSYVKKQTADGTWHEVSASAFYEEFVQKSKDGSPTNFWHKMAHNQLAKCAEALALRKAFPGDLSGIYTHEEMAQADVVESIPVEVKRIDEKEAAALKEIFQGCNPAYVSRVFGYLKKLQPRPVNSIEELPADLYERIKSSAIQNRDSYQAEIAQTQEDEPYPEAAEG